MDFEAARAGTDRHTHRQAHKTTTVTLRRACAEVNNALLGVHGLDKLGGGYVWFVVHVTSKVSLGTYYKCEIE